MHLFSIAPSLNPKENEIHIAKMAAVTKVLLPSISSSSKEEVALFCLDHELTRYVKKGTKLFTINDSLKDVFSQMIAHSTSNTTLDYFIPPHLDKKEDYYVKTLEKNLDYNKIKNTYSKTFEEENGFTVTLSNPFNTNDLHIFKTTFDDDLKVFENKKKFGFSIATLLKMGGINSTLSFENYVPSVANQQLKDLLMNFKEEFSTKLDN